VIIETVKKRKSLARKKKTRINEAGTSARRRAHSLRCASPRIDINRNQHQSKKIICKIIYRLARQSVPHRKKKIRIKVARKMNAARARAGDARMENARDEKSDQDIKGEEAAPKKEKK